MRQGKNITCRTQEKRDKRYHFALNAWQQIDRKEWKINLNHARQKQSTIKNLVKRYGIPSPYRYHVWKLLIGNDAHITKEFQCLCTTCDGSVRSGGGTEKLPIICT